MKSRSLSNPIVLKSIRSLTGLGLVLLTAMPTASVFAEDQAPSPAKTEAPAKPAKAKAAASTGPVECVRLGQRVIAALARDDSGAANQFHNFYIAFKCSPQHLAQAFGCLVNLQAANPGLSNPLPEHVKQCWDDPATIPKVQPQPPAEPAGEKK